MQVTKINGDRLSPWKMPLLTSTSHKSDPFELKKFPLLHAFLQKTSDGISNAKHVKTL